MKDPIDIGQDTINKAARDGMAIAVLRSRDTVKKIRVFELMDKQMPYLIGIYTSDIQPEIIGEDISYVFENNLCI